MKILENNIKDEYEIHISKEEFIEALSLLEKKHTQEKIADSISIAAYEIVDEDGNIECSNCGGRNCWGNYCMDCGARMIGRQSAYEYGKENRESTISNSPCNGCYECDFLPNEDCVYCEEER